MTVRVQSNPLKLVLALLAALGASVLLILATVPLDWRDQAIFGACMVFAAIVVDRTAKRQFGTLSLVLLSIFCTIRYATWRIGETWRYLEANGIDSLGTDLIFVLLLLGAECYAVVILLLGYFQAARPLQRQPEPLPQDPEAWPTVDIFVPTYNEPLDVVRPTVLGAMNIDWPKHKRKVYILDDGTRPEFAAFAAECGAGYVIRERHIHAKAGNINNALQQTNGEYVAIFDADHVATRSFLQMTMGWFVRDPKLAMMQTPHHFYSPDPFERNLDVFRKVSNEGSLFYGVLQDGNDLWNATFFCGSCAVIRRSALMEIGGIAVETVTEDAHTSLRLQKRGWNTAYLAVPQAAGLATANLAEHIGQRIRWSRGMVQILRVDNPLFARGLKWHQRLCYFNAVAHFLFALPRLIFLTAPLLYLLFGISNIIGYVVAILAYAMPHLILATMTNSRIQGRHRLSFWNEIYEVVLAPYILLPTMAALVNPKWGKFNVTPKSTKVDQSFFDWRVSSPFVALILLIFAGIGNGFLRIAADPTQAGTIWVNIAWCVTNLLILGGALAVANERAQRREKARVDTALECDLHLEGVATFATQTINISESGVALRLPAGCTAQPGNKGSIRFELFDGAVEIPVEVVVATNGSLRAFFPLNTLRHAEAVTRVLYGRADSWLDWKTGPDDRPLVSLAQIIWVSLRGYAAVFRAMFGGSRRKKAAAMAAAVLAVTLPVNGNAAAPAFSENFDLRSLGLREPALLHGTDGQASVRFQIPVTKITTEASLALSMRSPAAIQNEAFRIQVTLNGVDVAALPPGQNANITLPSDLLLTENQLLFHVVSSCSPCSQEAHAQDSYIDLNTAIHISGVLLPLANDLRLLPAPFFDASNRYRAQLPFVIAGDADHRTLEAAGVLASWFGALADHRGMHYPVSSASIPAGNAVVLALNGSPMARQLGIESNGAQVSIRDNPTDNHSKLLVISGSNGAQILAAAKAVALKANTMQGDIASIDARQDPAASARNINDAPRWADTRQPIALGSLVSKEALKVSGSGSTRMYFRLPPDLYYGSRTVVPLRLAYRYGTFTNASKGTIQVRLNGVQVAILTVTAKDSDRILNAPVQVPVGLLYPRNTLDFEFRHQAARGAGASPVGQIIGTSVLDLTEVRNFTQLPRLDLFANAGFPFTRSADLGQTAVALPANATAEQLALYLDLMSFFGSQTGYPAVRVRVIDPQEAAESDRDLLFIGAGAKDSALFAHAPLQESGKGFGPSSPKGFWGRIDRLFGTRLGGEASRLTDTLAADNPDAVLQAWASPQVSGRSVVAISTVTQRGATDFVDALATAAGAADASGSVSLYQNGKFTSFRIAGGDSYLGSLGPLQMFNYHAAKQLALLPVVIVLLCLLLGNLTSGWLERRAALRVKV
jgi:cellulose synthase (UDP-forming)